VVFDYAVDKLNMASKMPQEKQASKRNKIVESWKKGVLKKVEVLMEDLTRLLQMGFLKGRPLAINITIKKLTDLLNVDTQVLIRNFSEDTDRTLSFRYFATITLKRHSLSF